MLMHLLDGSTLTIGPEDCWLEEHAETATLIRTSGTQEESVELSQLELVRLRERRELVYTSW